jgi:hypothetical protein
MAADRVAMVAGKVRAGMAAVVMGGTVAKVELVAVGMVAAAMTVAAWLH